MTWARLGSVRRPSGERGGGGGLIGGEIGPPQLSPVSLDAARFDGHNNSELMLRGGGPDCRRSNETLCLVIKGSAAKDRCHAAAGYKSCGRLGAMSPTRSDGEPLDKGFYMFKKGAGEYCLSRGGRGVRRRVAAERLQ